MRTQVATVWQLALPGGSTASVERHGAAVLWRLRQPEGRAEVVGLAADEQEGRGAAARGHTNDSSGCRRHRRRRRRVSERHGDGLLRVL